MEIVVLDGYLVGNGNIDWNSVSSLGNFLNYDLTEGQHQILARTKNAHVICTNRCPVNREVIENAPNLKLIHSFGTGYNQIDLDAAKKAGVTVCNTPSYGRGAVAQMAITLMLAGARNLISFDHYMKTVGWSDSIDPNICRIPQMELTGKTLGIIGLGDIGYAVARIAMAMDMNILAYQRTPDPAKESAQLRFCTLEELIQSADIISLHCPLSEQTRHMISREQICQMKDGVMVINTSRGALVDEQAMLEALNSGKVAIYGADVFGSEPCGAENPLVLHPRCISTPHVAWTPLETRQRVVDIAGANIAGFLSGKPQNVVSTTA